MSKPIGKKYQAPSTHYWCEFCDKFIKNTSIDRKSHENGIPHQEAKAKKIAALRSASEDTKLNEQIAALEKAATASVAADAAHSAAYGSAYSTYTQSSTISYQLSPAVVTSKISTSVSSKPDPLANSTPKTAPAEPPVVEEKSKEAALPGRWEVVEENDKENPYHEIEDDADVKPNTNNSKKRERYGEDENALEQMEAESRIMTSTTTTERVPEVYRPSTVSAASEEPVFKAKLAKGANVKKRVKQL